MYFFKYLDIYILQIFTYVRFTIIYTLLKAITLPITIITYIFYNGNIFLYFFIKFIMKEKFIKSTLILLVGGLITKLLGMLIKIVMARLIGTKGLGMYMLILPTFSLFISLSQFGIPVALSKLISEDTRNNKKLLFSNFPILILVNIVLIIIIILTAPIISNNLLHNKDLYPSILAISLVIPFSSISSICRSYFFGKQRMLPHVVSNITEDIVRLIIMIIGIPYFIKFGLKYTILFIILSNIISEITSTIILLLFLPKKLSITRNDLKPNKNYLLDSLRICIPNTTSRLIGSIGYFLEPIILTTTLLSLNYSNNYITSEYGIITGYVLPLLLLPSFFTLAISSALLPVISKAYVNGNKKYIKNKLFLAIILSLIIGIPITIFFTLKPDIFLQLIYHTNEGKTYLKVLAPICLFQYLQAPLTSCLDAIGKSKTNLIAISIGTITRTVLLYLLSYLRIGIWNLIISTSINILLVTIYQIKKVNQYLN